MTDTTATVYIIDDDPQVCETLNLMIRSAGMEAKSYPSAEAFLADFRCAPEWPQCLLLDVRLPGMDGLGLQRVLAERGCQAPVIMMSGCADVPMAVQAMSAGALDFLEKPFDRETLLGRIQDALARYVQNQRRQARRSELAARLKNLSARQRQVVELMVSGKHTKQIAGELGISEKTVAKHRATAFEKMQVENVVELVRLISEV